MVHDPVVAVEDEQPNRSGCPPFPWSQLRYILTLGGEYCPDTSAKPVPMITHRMFDGLRAEALEGANLSQGRALTALARAFDDSRVYHGLRAAHWNVLMSCEVGVVRLTSASKPLTDRSGRTHQRIVSRLALYNPDRPDAVMPFHEAARAFGLVEDGIGRYLREAKDAVETEWRYTWSGWEK
jgi:hypothetical protein